MNDIVKAGKRHLVLRYNNYKKIDFISEHIKGIMENGEIWILKVGKMLNGNSIQSVIDDGGGLILKSPIKTGNKYYYCKLNCYINGIPKEDMKYPTYYNILFENGFSSNGTWLKVSSIVELPEKDIEGLSLLINDKKLVTVIAQTRTPVLYVTNKLELHI